MLAITDHCARCYHPLTAEHAVRAGAHHCYGCELRLLRDEDALRVPLRPLRLRRRSRRPIALPARPGYPATGVAARRPGPPVRRRRPVA